MTEWYRARAGESTTTKATRMLASVRPGARVSVAAGAAFTAALLLLAAGPNTRASASSPAQIQLARQHIKHVVFIIKENRTFDTLFGLFPGADGAHWGQECDGKWIRLRQAVDRQEGAAHSFTAGIIAENGGRM